MKISPVQINLRAIIVQKYSKPEIEKRKFLGTRKVTRYYILIQFVLSPVTTVISLSKHLYDKLVLGQIIALDTVLGFTQMYTATSTAPHPRNDILRSAGPQPKVEEPEKPATITECKDGGTANS